jgi:hypothetical protein
MAHQYYFIPEHKIDDKNSDRLIRLDDEYLNDSIEEMWSNEPDTGLDYESYKAGYMALARQLREYVS